MGISKKKVSVIEEVDCFIPALKELNPDVIAVTWLRLDFAFADGV